MDTNKLLRPTLTQKIGEKEEDGRIPKCQICQKAPAKYDKSYGFIMCDQCQMEDESGGKIIKLHEFTSSSIKNERVKYSKSMLQPYYKGALSKEYIDAWGTSKLSGVT